MKARQGTLDDIKEESVSENFCQSHEHMVSLKFINSLKSPSENNIAPTQDKMASLRANNKSLTTIIVDPKELKESHQQLLNKEIEIEQLKNHWYQERKQTQQDINEYLSMQELAQKELDFYKNQSKVLTIKLLQYWKSLSKDLDPEFEEILQMNCDSDANDVLDALILICEAHRENKIENQAKISSLQAELFNLQQQQEIQNDSPVLKIKKDIDEFKLLKQQESSDIRQILSMWQEMNSQIKCFSTISENTQQTSIQLSEMKTSNETTVQLLHHELKQIREMETSLISALKENEQQKSKLFSKPHSLNEICIENLINHEVKQESPEPFESRICHPPNIVLESSINPIESPNRQSFSSRNFQSIRNVPIKSNFSSYLIDVKPKLVTGVHFSTKNAFNSKQK